MMVAERKTQVLRVVDGLRVFELGSTTIPSFGIGPEPKETTARWQPPKVPERQTRVLRVVDGLRVFDLGSTTIPSFGIGPEPKEKKAKKDRER